MLPIIPGLMLVASPLLGDSNFARTVVFVLEHNEHGTLGLIVNRPLDISLGDLWSACPSALRALHRCADGGPVERDKGLILHGIQDLPGSLPLCAGLAVGGDAAQANPDDPLAPRLFLGHSGWSPGQLEAEITSGSWLLRPGHRRFVLDPEAGEDLWDELARTEDPAPPPGNN